MALTDVHIGPLDGGEGNLVPQPGVVTLVVNVASRCGMTPQYAGLERLHEKYAPQGFTVLGVPCNQFGGQEPGTSEEIAEFCSTTYGVRFPLTEKVDVNGEHRHPLYAQLVDTPDDRGYAGDIRWNFEKFLVDAHGKVVARFHFKTEPESELIVHAIEKALADR